MRFVRRAGLALLGLLGTFSPAPGIAQQPEMSAAAAPRIALVTFGPGTGDVWERFGHNMIRVADSATGTDLAYNFGIFDFHQKNFFLNFLQGRMVYAGAAWPARATIDTYIAHGRSVGDQELALTSGQARALAENLARSVQPDRRDYRYDYYRDNCSIRVRDALDLVLGGAIKRELSQIQTTATYRSRTAELTAAAPGWYFLLMVFLGPSTDRPLSAWEDSFIPMQFAHYVAPLVNPALGGATTPLVSASSFLPESDAVADATRAPAGLLGWFLVIGVLLGGALAWSGGRAGQGRGRMPFLTIGGLWTLLSGIAGFSMLYLWAFTDHVVAYRNENILQASVLGLVMFGMLAGWARRSGALSDGVRVLALVVAALSLLGVALQVLPWFSQANAVALVVFVPANLGMALGAARAAAAPATIPGPTAALP